MISEVLIVISLMMTWYNTPMKKRVVLAILDGWGVGRQDPSNPIYTVKPRSLEYLRSRYPFGALQASGIAVGLPWGEVGNSEVGHLTIGAGKIIFQHYPRITLSIERGKFFKNEVFTAAFEHVKTNNSALNIAGLLTAGHIHASFDHLQALLEYAAQQGVGQINLHLFADGKDSPPQSVSKLLEKLKKVTDHLGVGVLASISGRHFSLDRDSHWDRTQAAYEVMTGRVPTSPEKLETIIASTYEQGKNDQEIPPTLLLGKTSAIKDGDALIFIDFREDSIRQIAEAFIDKEFKAFPIQKFSNLHIVTMTEYTAAFQVPVAFPSEEVTHPLGRVLSDAGKQQLLLAETEKYAHVTYFFNGFQDDPFPGQESALLPSNNVESHAERPEMRARELADKVLETLQAGQKDFIVVNFANADMVAHTGNFDAAAQAVRTIDTELGRVIKYCEEQDVALVITADHGNVEVMRDPITGEMDTSHDPSPVPIYICAKQMLRTKPNTNPDQSEGGAIGILSDVAPSILELFDLPKPPEMSGQSLLPVLRVD